MIQRGKEKTLIWCASELFEIGPAERKTEQIDFVFRDVLPFPLDLNPIASSAAIRFFTEYPLFELSNTTLTNIVKLSNKSFNNFFGDSVKFIFDNVGTWTSTITDHIPLVATIKMGFQTLLKYAQIGLLIFVVVFVFYVYNKYK